MYVSVHEHAKHSTPESLRQSYVVCDLHEKLDMLWSFIRNHLKQKILVFMASCKQVRDCTWYMVLHFHIECSVIPFAAYGS